MKGEAKEWEAGKPKRRKGKGWDENCYMLGAEELRIALAKTRREFTALRLLIADSFPVLLAHRATL